MESQEQNVDVASEANKTSARVRIVKLVNKEIEQLEERKKKIDDELEELRRTKAYLVEGGISPATKISPVRVPMPPRGGIS